MVWETRHTKDKGDTEVTGTPNITVYKNPTFDLEMNGIEPRITGWNPLTLPGMDIYIVYKID